MAEPTLEFLAEQQKQILTELRAMRVEMRDMRQDIRRNAEATAALNRRTHDDRDDMITMIRAEIGGLFAHLETRLEQRIGEEIRERMS